MKQKIVLEIGMDCQKCGNKALKIAGSVEGVTDVWLDGEKKVVVIGNNINTICLANKLSDNFRSMNILSVEEVKPVNEENNQDTNNNKNNKKKCNCDVCCIKKNQCTTEHVKTIIICSNCKSSKCDGKCCVIKTCSKCQSPKCEGHYCSPKHHHHVHPPHHHIHHHRCPPWCTCPRCYYVPPPPPPPPYSYRVVYDSYNDGFGCSIM